MAKKFGLTGWILAAMIAGAALGLGVHHGAGPKFLGWFVKVSGLLMDIFLRLIKMIIAPLVFSTLVAGIARLGDVRTVGRIGAKAMGWFILASLISLGLGLVMMNLFPLGTVLKLPADPAAPAVGSAQGLSLDNFVGHVFPRSIVEALANNEVLQIVVFSVFFGVAAAASGEKGQLIVRALDAVTEIILRVTGYVMKFAPVAAFAAIASIIAVKGAGLLFVYGKFIGLFYLTMLLLWGLLVGLASTVLGRQAFRLVVQVRHVILLAFGTASSEAAFPKLMAELEAFGCPPRIVSFVLPLGYSFNLDGSMLYISFASLFIAQAYGVPLGLGQQAAMLLVMMLTSKGVAGVPRAALVVIAGTLSLFDIPQQGLLLLLGIDQIMDMGRTATNVVGNSLATAAVYRLERGALGQNR